MSRRRVRWLVGLLVLLLAACGGALSARRSPRPAASVAQGASNVRRGDYAGSASCEPCHAAIYRLWEHSPMHRMTRLAEHAEVRGHFDGGVFRFGADAVTVSRRGDERFMELAVAGQAPAVYRVTRVVGGRYREDYVGVHVADASAGARVVGDPRAELVLPISWVFATGSWRYKGYSVMVRERPGMRAGPEWRATCIFCHNTVPLLDTVLDELHGPGAPPYQSTPQDRLLPAARLFHAEVTDADGLAAAVDEEVAHLGGRPSGGGGDDLHRVLAHAIHETRDRFDGSSLVEVGIGCEACHNGAREHALHPTTPTSFEARSDLFRLAAPPDTPGSARAQAINHTCLRCHTVLFSHYPYTWEGGSRQGPSPGGSHVNSGEARDFLLGGCASDMSCAHCHDPHTEDSAASLHALETPAGNASCTGCHQELRPDAALAAHSHHAVGHAGAVCINCHMPRKNMGLNYNLTRYHRIGSPNDPARVEHDRPLECALCHADLSAGSLVSTMEQWWGRRYDRNALRTLYGPDLGVNPLRWTAAHGLPHEVAVAVSVLGRERARDALPLMAEQLNNPYPLVRFFAWRAMEETTGSPIPIDPHDDGTVLVAQARAWLSAHP